MTIRVTIKNEEAVGGKWIRVHVVDRQRDKPQREYYAGVIEPGNTKEFTVHAAKHLIIDEQIS